MWKKTLCFAVAVWAIAVCAHSAGAVPVYAEVPLVGAGEMDGRVYVWLGVNPLFGTGRGPIMEVDTQSVPHALDIGIAAAQSGNSVGVFYVPQSGDKAAYVVGLGILKK